MSHELTTLGFTFGEQGSAAQKSSTFTPGKATGLAHAGVSAGSLADLSAQGLCWYPAPVRSPRFAAAPLKRMGGRSRQKRHLIRGAFRGRAGAVPAFPGAHPQWSVLRPE